MRYTTVIDISEIPDVYRNQNARIIYLHLALKSGYHDNDRDRITTSIRRIAYETGTTVSAVRHTLHLLEKAQLIARDGETWTVKKWTVVEPPTPRTQKTVDRQASNLGERWEREKREAEQKNREYQEKVLAAVRASSKEELQTWLSELQDRRSLAHHGVRMYANQANIEWLKKIIEKT